MPLLEVRGRRAREREAAEAGPAASETCGVWAECLPGSHQDSEMVLSANRKNYSGCCAENGLARAGLGQVDQVEGMTTVQTRWGNLGQSSVNAEN